MKKSGFTLIEIMIVVAVIGLLAAIGIPSFQKAHTNSLKNSMENNARLMASGIAQFAMENGLSENSPIQQTDVESYIKGGWGELTIGRTQATFPAGTTVGYWTTNASVIAEDLYQTAYSTL